MKKNILVLLVLFSILDSYSSDMSTQLEKYRIPNYSSEKEFKALEGKVFTYIPASNKYNEKMIQKFGKIARQFKVLKISIGREKKKTPGVYRSDWELRDIATKEDFDIVVYLGDVKMLEEKYNDLFWDDEVRIYDLPLYNFVGKYETTLSKVEKPDNPEIQYGEIKTVTDSLTKYQYADNYLDITIYGNSMKFYFELKNNSPYSLKLLWDDASFVGVDGTSSKIMHNGIKYSEREYSSQPPSTIIRGATLEDEALPTRNVFYSESVNKWLVLPMYPLIPNFEEKEQVLLMLPIQIKGVTNEYLFIFDVTYKYAKSI